jgi:hypothetical protein
MISSMVSMLPPGVLSWITNTSALRCSAIVIPRLMYSNIGGMIGPSAVITKASGASPWARADWNASESAANRIRNKAYVRRMDFMTDSLCCDYYNGLWDEEN